MKKMLTQKWKREKAVVEREKELKAGKDWTLEQKVNRVETN